MPGHACHPAKTSYFCAPHIHWFVFNWVNNMKRYILAFLVLLPVIVQAQSTTWSFPAKTEGFQTEEILETSFAFSIGISGMTIMTTERTAGTFNIIDLPGSMRNLAIPGYPDLPLITRLIALPEGAIPEIDILEDASQTVDLKIRHNAHPIIPVQPSVSKADDPASQPFHYLREVYQQDAFSQQKIVSIEYLGRMRGVRIARISISPFRYNPVRQLLEVHHSLTIRVRYTGADLGATRAMREKYASPVFRQSLHTLVNYPEAAQLQVIQQAPLKMVIVSDPAFQQALQPFIAWKVRKGFKVIEAYMSNPLVGNTTTSIKAYLQNLYQGATPTDPAPSFAILVGDVAQIPAFTGTTGSHPSDLYYFEYDGSGDYFPELFYGRFSANNLAELQPQIDKTLQYEQFLLPDTSFLNRVVMVAGVDSYYGSTHANGQINYGNAYYFNAAHGLSSSTYLYPASGSSSSQIRADISNGVGFANYTAHCGTTGWSDPSFTTAHISNLENNHKYPLVIGNCCLSNKFDQTCFGEALVRAAGKGALGYIGGSNNTLWDEDFYWSVGVGTPGANPTYAGTGLGAYDRLFHDHGEPRSEWYETNGQIIMAGNLAVTASTSTEIKYYWEIYHLMGDPSVMTYFSAPPALPVTHAPVQPLGLNTFNAVTVPYAYAALSMNGILHGAAFADSLGQVSMNILPFTTPGYAHLVVTRQNRQPYIDSVLVASPNGPFVLMNQVVLKDTNGNGNGRADFGEPITFDVSVVNYGNAMAGQVSVRLSTADTFVTITDSLESLGWVGAGDTVMLPAGFAVQIHQHIPDAHQVPFQLHISDTAGNSWSSAFFIKLHAPNLRIRDISIMDQVGGNGNGSIDPGEVIQLVIRAANEGHCNALNAMATLVTYSPLASINNAQIILDTLKENQEVNLVFDVYVAHAALPGDVIEVHCSLGSGLYLAQQSFAPMVGSQVEDWETATLTKFSWVSGGSQPWYVVNTGAYEGDYAVRSGSIGNTASSSLELTMTVLSNDSISFYRKVSSELDYDFLEFYIDNNLKEQWSGQKDWARAVYAVQPGQRSFRWVYVKDWYLASGSDCAWVDLIHFPPAAGIVTGRETPASVTADVRVYPNPAQDEVTVDVIMPRDEEATLSLYDLQGRLLYATTLPATGEQMRHDRLDLSGYQAGIMHLTVKTKSTQISRRIVVLR